MKRTINLGILLLGLLVTSGSVILAAEKVYFPQFELINVHSDYRYSTSKLLKNYVDEQGSFTIVMSQKNDSTLSQLPINQIQELAKAADCPYFLVGDLNRMGETVIISITLYNTSDASQRWKDRLKASSPDDMDPILQKIARQIGTEKKAGADGDIYSVTDYESRQLKQMKSINSFGMALGGTVFMSDAFTEDPFSAGGGIFWLYDARTLLFEIHGQMYFTGNSYMTNISIEAYKPLESLANSFFIGGGLGLGHTSYDSSENNSVFSDPDYTGDGLMLILGGGYIFGRTSSVSLRIHAKYFFGIHNMKGYTGGYYNENPQKKPDKSFPHGLVLNLEIYFGSGGSFF
ncbi:MAG: hypothetical protein HW421_1287 [Ignavibacteria bacterium]|nr:hypothetical protein [Ignavibacteria bacterium]